MAGGYDGSLKFDTAIDEKGFNSGITKLGSLAKGGLKVVAAAVAGVATAFGAVTKASLDSVASLEQNIGGVETLFKDSAQTVIDNANMAYKTAGVSANKYMETVTSFSASLLQGLGGDTAEAARIADMAMVDMSDNANKFGTNMEDIQNAYQGFAKQNYTMLDNLKLGYGGTQSEMIRLINDSGILNEKIENLDNVSFDQIIQAIHKIQENMGVAGTTSEEALTTIEGSVNAAKAAFDNFLNGSSSPQELADAVITAGKNILNNLMEIVPRLAEELPQVGSMLMDGLSESLNSGKLNELMAVGGEIVSNLTTGIISALPGLVTAAAQIISSFSANIGSSIPQLLSSGMQIIQAIVSGMLQVLPAVGTFVIQLITALYEQLTAQGPGLLQKGYELLSNIINGFVQAIPEVLPKVLDFIQGIGEQLASVAPVMIQKGYELLSNIINGFVQAIPVALPKVLDFIQGIGEQLASAAPVMIQKGFELLSKLVEGIVSAIPILIERVPEIISTFANVINDNFPTILAKGVELIGQLIKGIIQAIPTLVANIPKIVSAIVDVIEAFNWLNLGKNIITLFKNGITGMVGAVKSAGKSVYDGLHNAIKNLPTTLSNIGKSAMNGLKSAISSAVGTVRSAAQSVGTGILNALKSIPSQVISIGKNIVTGLWNGISGMVGWMTNKVKSFANSILGGIKNALGIHSPSQVMRDEVGKMMALGTGVGFEQNLPVDEMSSSLSDSVKRMQRRAVTIMQKPMITTGQVVATSQGGKGKDNNPQPFDYDRMGEATAKAMEGMGIYMDSKPVGKLVTPTVNEELGKLDRRKT